MTTCLSIPCLGRQCGPDTDSSFLSLILCVIVLVWDPPFIRWPPGWEPLAWVPGVWSFEWLDPRSSLILDLLSSIHEMILIQDPPFMRCLRTPCMSAWPASVVLWPDSCTTCSFVHYRRRWRGSYGSLTSVISQITSTPGEKGGKELYSGVSCGCMIDANLKHEEETEISRTIKYSEIETKICL